MLGSMQEVSMTLIILDPRTGQKVTISVPDTPLFSARISS
jgi:hypothetical protein